jgi:hypothetical protein
LEADRHDVLADAFVVDDGSALAAAHFEHSNVLIAASSQKLERIDKCMYGGLVWRQGDWRIFTYVYLGWLFTLGSFLKLTKVAHIVGVNAVKVMY